MAIQTVDASNLNDFVAERTAKGSKIATGEQMVEAADRIATAKSGDRAPTPGNPVITSGVERSADAPPEPSGGEPTAKVSADTKAQVDKAKAGTDPGIQKRLDELTRARKEAEEFAEDEYNGRLRAEGRVQELEKQLAAAKPPEPKVEELTRPKPTDFTDQPAYDAAMEAYDKAREERIFARARAEAKAQAEVDRLNAALEKRTEQVRKDIPDFDEEIARAAKENFTPPPYIQAALRESEYGLHLAYHLSKNRDDYKRIVALTPAAAVLELGRISLKFQNAEVAEKPPAPIETTRAPAPVASIKAESGSVPVDLSTERDFVRYKEARLEQIRKRRRH